MANKRRTKEIIEHAFFWLQQTTIDRFYENNKTWEQNAIEKRYINAADMTRVYRCRSVYHQRR